MSLATKLGLGTLCALAVAVSALYAADSAEEVDTAIADLDGQFDDTRADAPEIVQSFWDGFDSGLTTTTA
jgi:hypothetical protein